MFAIVDIETTGGYATANGITEIAIAVHDGEKLIEFFETLINPYMPIPRYIQALTGITDEMVSDAPSFADVSEKIYLMLQNAVFVAHNVNFDYSFVKHHLSIYGFQLDCKKLCTVRLSRRLLPGYKSYSLGNICRSLNIVIDNRHRAGGDALATVKLFEKILENDVSGEVAAMIRHRSKDQYLPPHLSVDQVQNLPDCAGVYYFLNAKGKIIYVGKAKNLKKRVHSHFSNNKTGRQKQDFLREIHQITFEPCGSELMAFILESVEIKRLWPIYNRSLKGFEQVYGLYIFEDGRGYKRLVIEKKKKHLQPVYTFTLLIDGLNVLKNLIRDFSLCARMCFVDVSPGPSLAETVDVTTYNERVDKAIAHLHATLPTFALVDEVKTGVNNHSMGVVLMEKGRFYGMGYIPAGASCNEISAIKACCTPYPESDYIRGLVYQFASRFPHKKLELANTA